MVRLEYMTPMGKAWFDLDDFDGDEVVVGRSRQCDVVFKEEGSDDEVSRKHAVIEWVAKQWCVRDLDAMYGTFVNGKKVAGPHPLRNNDEIRLGPKRWLRFIWDELEITAPTTPGAKPPALTPGERRVLKELVRPYFKQPRPGRFVEPATVAEIAERLVVGEGAVKAHLQSMYEKFGIEAGPRRRLRLAEEAIDRKAIAEDDYADEDPEPDAGE